MTNIAILLAIWILAFGLLALPARPVGKWMARDGAGPILAALNILLCVAIAVNVVLIGWLALMVSKFFPHFNSDPMGFGLVFAAVLLFPPAFGTLVAAYLRARKAISA